MLSVVETKVKRKQELWSCCLFFFATTFVRFYLLLCLQFEIRQLRAHLAQQDLDLTAEREAAMQIQHAWGKQARGFQVVEGPTPGESDDESGQKTSRKPRASAGGVSKGRGATRWQGL